MGSLVHCDDFDGLARLTLNRPDELNALTVVVPRDAFGDEVDALVGRVIANSAFSHRANKRLLDATDGSPLDAGLQWEVVETEGVGPDMAGRIAAFAGKRG